jgi:hypothetical protein
MIGAKFHSTIHFFVWFVVQMIVDSFVKERKNGFRLEKGLKLQVAQAMLQ